MHLKTAPLTFLWALTLAAAVTLPAHSAPASVAPQPVLRLEATAQGEGACLADEHTLCLLDERIAARLRWHNQRDDSSGDGFAKPLGERTGAFWFFREDNLELLVKAIDGTSKNGYYWIFLGSLSDLEFSLEVQNTGTGEIQTYYNPPGHLYGIADTRALILDPPQQCGGIAGLPCPEGFFCELDGGCGILDAGGICEPVPEACPEIFDPVCACDGTTYSNDCERRRAHAWLDHPGACEEPLPEP